MSPDAWVLGWADAIRSREVDEAAEHARVKARVEEILAATEE